MFEVDWNAVFTFGLGTLMLGNLALLLRVQHSLDTKISAVQTDLHARMTKERNARLQDERRLITREELAEITHLRHEVLVERLAHLEEKLEWATGVSNRPAKDRAT